MLRRKAWHIAQNDAGDGGGADCRRWSVAIFADAVCAVSVAAVILAAGASTRLGRPKQTLEIAGESLVERAVRAAEEAGCTPIIVVINSESDFGDRLQQRGCRIVVNPDAAQGMAWSIRWGIRFAQALNAQGAIIMTCDQPGLQPEHLRALSVDANEITGSEYAGRVGVPAY